MNKYFVFKINDEDAYEQVSNALSEESAFEFKKSMEQSGIFGKRLYIFRLEE